MKDNPRPADGKDVTDLLKHLPLTLMSRRARPRIAWTDSLGEHHRALSRRLLVGSATHVHAVVQDRSVSRLHAELEVRPDGVWVRDLGSTNGTWVNGVLVQSARVAQGDTLRVGAVTIHVAYTAETENVSLWPTDQFGDLFGRCEAMRELFFLMSKCVAGDAAILISGETGTGKQLVAQAIHDASPRAMEPFVVVDCAGLPEDELERELFGEVSSAARGALESAHGGTVFLDEIGELPLSLQPRLLRVLETRSVRRLGEVAARPLDVRVMSATRHDLRAMVGAQAFREDLYFRLAVLPLELPALRDRRDDCITLLERWLADVVVGLDDETKRALLQYRWPGNVRELKNFASRVRSIGLAAAKVSLEGGDVQISALRGARTPQGAAGAALPTPPVDRSFKDVREAWVDHLEREYIGSLLRLHGRNVGAVAEAAGLDRSYVHRLLRKHDL